MKIAFVGKGGSGKSSVSWLVAKTGEKRPDTHVLAIDADHNMDLVSNLGYEPSSITCMHKNDKEFMEKAIATCCSGHETGHNHTPHFNVYPKDDYTKSISTDISDNLSLINIGLGSPEIQFTTSCAHGVVGPLKYYLGFLHEDNNLVVIDSVAGADMLNYGLYSGIDAVICVVEPHRNSIKVFEQIKDICRKTMIKCYMVINKPNGSDLYKSLREKYKDELLGEIPLDDAILEYSYESLKEETIESGKNILNEIYKLKRKNTLS